VRARPCRLPRPAGLRGVGWRGDGRRGDPAGRSPGRPACPDRRMSWLGLVPLLLLTGHTVVNAALLRRLPRGAVTDARVAVLLPLRDEAGRVTPCLEAL